MKRLIPLAALLFLTVASAPVFALDSNADRSDRSDRNHRSVVDDVIRMAQAGVGDDAIISFVVHSRDRFVVSADDVIALNNAHVSKEVIKAVMDESNDRGNNGYERRGDASTTVAYAAPPPVYYGYGWYDPYYPYYYYDPFFYGPRVAIGVGFGFGHFGGGFRGHGHR